MGAATFAAEEQVGTGADEPDGCRSTKPCGWVLFDLFAQRAQLLGGIFLAGDNARSGIFGELACAACHGLTRSMCETRLPISWRRSETSSLTRESKLAARAS